MTRFIKHREIGQYLFRVMKPQDYDQVINITSQAFPQREQTFQGLGISEAEFENFMCHFKDRFTLNGESAVAVEKNTGNVIAAQLNEDYNSEVNETMIQGLSPKLLALIQYFDRVKEIIYKNNLLGSPYQLGKKNQLFYIFSMATHHDHLNKGLMNQLIYLSEEIAQKKGYQASFVEASSPISQHIMKKHNFKVIYEDAYDQIKIGDFSMDMSKASHGFREGTKPGVRFMFKELNQNNTQ